jgi:hypothetical protein
MRSAKLTLSPSCSASLHNRIQQSTTCTGQNGLLQNFATKPIDVLCSTRETIEAEGILTPRPGREFQVTLAPVEKDYDVIMIDVAPVDYPASELCDDVHAAGRHSPHSGSVELAGRICRDPELAIAQYASRQAYGRPLSSLSWSIGGCR